MNRKFYKTNDGVLAFMPYGWNKLLAEGEKLFGKEISGMTPSYFPTEDSFLLHPFGPAKIDKKLSNANFSVNFRECVDFIKNNNFLFPNWPGLLIAVHWDKIYHFLDEGIFYLGLDREENLFFDKANGGYKVPVVVKDGKGVYLYFSLPVGPETKIEADEIPIAIIKQAA